ncbi:MAG TPA: response regulator, partial [Allocoleopsis sp.]
LISDIGMADMDGYMLMQQIRKVTQTSQIPAIALTAYISEADQQQALAAGFQEHLPKPMEPTQLVATILKVVQES